MGKTQTGKTTKRKVSERKLPESLWRYWKVTMTFRDRIYGGIPKSAAVIRTWLETKLGVSKETEALIEKTMEEMKADVDDEEKKGWTGFKSDEQGLYVEGRQVKAMIKEGAHVLREKCGITAFKSRVAERVFVVHEDSRLHLDGKMEPDGVEEGPIHVMSRKGPLTALKKTDYVEGIVLTFRLKVLDTALAIVDSKTKVGPEAYLPVVLEWNQEGGFGANRSQGAGTFDVTCFDEIARPQSDGSSSKSVFARAEG